MCRLKKNKALTVEKSIKYLLFNLLRKWHGLCRERERERESLSSQLKEVFKRLRGDRKIADLQTQVDILQAQVLHLAGVLHQSGILKNSAEHFGFLLSRAAVAPRYHRVFYDFYRRNQLGESLVMIDGGVHQGTFSDLALFCGAKVYGFEPNRYLATFLRTLYSNNPDFHFFEAAISVQNAALSFLDCGEDCVDSAGGSIVHFGGTFEKLVKQTSHYAVQSIDFSQFVKDLLEKHPKIHCIKLDIEGAEFEVLDALLCQDLLVDVEYVMVETHERFFENPESKLATLKNKIKEKGLSNIYLDWV